MTTNQQNTHPFQIFLIRAGSLVLIIASVFLIGLALLSLSHELNLHFHGKIVDATVTNLQPKQRHYQVQYQFGVDTATYTHTDLLGSENTWTVLPTSALADNQVAVLYLPHNPAINRPLEYNTHPLESAFVIFMLGIMGIVISEMIWGINNGSSTATLPAPRSLQDKMGADGKLR